MSQDDAILRRKKTYHRTKSYRFYWSILFKKRLQFLQEKICIHFSLLSEHQISATKSNQVQLSDNLLPPGFILRTFQKKQVTIQVGRQTNFTET